jgi:hypothetical protein
MSATFDRSETQPPRDERPIRRRSSRQITLVLIGTASLASCGEPVPDQIAQRDVYEHRSQCVQDWGDEKRCEVVTQGPHRGYWYGPGYIGARNAPSSASQRIGTTMEPVSGSRSSASSSRISRSGFGSSASSHSSFSGS